MDLHEYIFAALSISSEPIHHISEEKKTFIYVPIYTLIYIYINLALHSN